MLSDEMMERKALETAGLKCNREKFQDDQNEKLKRSQA